MRIVCCQCKAYLGEKCPKCGKSDAVIQRWTNRRSPIGIIIGTLSDFFCIGCSLAFAPGAGGETHTFCDACREMMLAESRKATTVARSAP